MAFDPSTIGSIGDNLPDPMAAAGKAYALKDVVDREQLQSLQLGQARRQAGEDAQVQEILKNSKYDTPQGLAETAEKVNKVSPRAGMEFMKWGQQYQSLKVQNTLDMLTVAEKRQDTLVSAIDPILAQAEQIKNSGGGDLAADAFIMKQMPQVLQQLRGMKLEDDQPVIPDSMLQRITSAKMGLQTLKSWEGTTKAGAANIKQRLEQFKADTQARRENETERHNQTVEMLNATKEQHRESTDSHGYITDDAADLAAQRLLNGEKASDVLANFGRGKQGPENIAKVQNRFAELAKEQGISPQDITNRRIEMAGVVKEEQTAAAISGKIRYAENEIKQIAPKVLEQSAKVPRGSFVPWNKLKLYGEKQISSPELKKLKAYLTTLTNSYDVLGGRGGTDVEKRAHNRELLDSADSPEALAAAVDAIQQEAALSGEAATESLRRTGAATPGAKAAAEKVSSAGAAPSPQGSSPPEAAPTGGLSAEDSQAIAWANAHPNDPRAAQIKALHGGQ